MTEVKAGSTRIRRCSICGRQKHSQDEIHGKGKRVFIYTSTSSRGGVWRCTVCGGDAKQ